MNCANHSDTAAVAFCRTCGKPLCPNCTRDVRGVIYCESCLAARMEGAVWRRDSLLCRRYHRYRLCRHNLVISRLWIRRLCRELRLRLGPNPAVAGILAVFFPFGVGAVYCSQYAKGLAHLLIFVLLIYGADHAGNWDWIFGLGIAFFYVYQIIDSIRTAKAVQAGQPAPDPWGWDMLSTWGTSSSQGRCRSAQSS